MKKIGVAKKMDCRTGVEECIALALQEGPKGLSKCT